MEEIAEESNIMKALINQGKFLEAVKHAYADEFTYIHTYMILLIQYKYKYSVGESVGCIEGEAL